MTVDAIIAFMFVAIAMLFLCGLAAILAVLERIFPAFSRRLDAYLGTEPRWDDPWR